MWILGFIITFVVEGYSVNYTQTFLTEQECLINATQWVSHDIEDKTIELDLITVCEQEITE